MNTVQSPDWQLSLNDSSALVEGLADISQCIDIVLNTQIGSDPMRPTFGTDYTSIDSPVNVAAPNMVIAITNAIQRWETRATLQQVYYSIESENIVFSVKWTSKYGDGSNLLTL